MGITHKKPEQHRNAVNPNTPLNNETVICQACIVLGVILKYVVKAGECQRVCCGAGGPLVLEQKCTPSDKCEGIKLGTKEEIGHCHKEEIGTCGNEDCTTPAPTTSGGKCQ